MIDLDGLDLDELDLDEFGPEGRELAAELVAAGLRGPGSHAPRPRSTRGGRHATARFATQAVSRAIAALIVIGLVGTLAFLVLGGDRSPAPSSPALSLEDVFPDPARIPADGTRPAYTIAMTHIDRDCATATTGALTTLIGDGGCGQVIRAALTGPYGDYQVTAGLFDLADQSTAARVDDRIRQVVETGDGGFAAMGTGQAAAATDAAQVGWHAVGHYLLYCVITRPGGRVVPGGDPNAARMTTDLVDGYLTSRVSGARSSGS